MMMTKYEAKGSGTAMRWRRKAHNTHFWLAVLVLVGLDETSGLAQKGEEARTAGGLKAFRTPPPRAATTAGPHRRLPPAVGLAPPPSTPGLAPPSALAATPAPSPTPDPPSVSPAANATPPAAGDTLLPGEKEATKECKKYPPNKRFKWELRGEVDLMTMLNAMAPMLCRPFIVPASVRQSKVTIIAPDTLTAPEAYRMFLSALESMGLTVQPEGKVLKIIESSRARESAIPLYSDGNPPAQDQWVTRLIRLEHVSIDDVKGVLDRLKGKDADITVYPPTNTLVVTDLATNVRRMEQVVKQLDVAMGGEKIYVKKLHTVSATELAPLLQTIFNVGQKGAATGGARPAAPSRLGGPTRTTPATTSSGGAAPSGGSISISQILPDERNNLLIVVATEQGYQRVLALVNRLDTQLERGDSLSEVVHVIPLENAIADDVAGTIGGLGATVSRSAGGGAPGHPGGPAPPGRPTSQGGAGAAQLFESDVRIAADRPTNSLVVLASGRDYVTLRELVKKLDIPRRQVFVEAVILEVSIDKTRRLGTAWHYGSTVGSGNDQSLLFGGSQPSSDVNSILISPTMLTGLAAELRGPPIPGADRILGLPPGASLPAFGVFVQALQNNGDVNVVSMPHVLTTDNEKATIQVGQNLPFPGTFGGIPALGVGATGALPTGFGTSVQRQDVALKLDITPHVNDSDFVRLEIDNELSDVANPNFNGLGPSTSKRHVKSTVTVRDQQTIVIGGLIKDSISEQVNKVPLLGDIPILGYLFKRTEKTILKQNLLIILTPYVIKDPSDLRKIFERKLRERQEFLERYSAFKDDRDYEARVDYRRKRGLLEEINRTAVEAEQEAAELQAAEAAIRARDIEGPVEITPRQPLSPPQPPREPQ
jgi:general secretion pathway protein D